MTEARWQFLAEALAWPGAQEPTRVEDVPADMHVSLDEIDANLSDLWRLAYEHAADAPLDELCENYAMATCAVHALRMTADLGLDSVRFLKAIREKTHAGHSLGGKKKAENSPAKAAKDEAERLWPEANRKGWKAARFHAALTEAGHAVPYDSARKWLTQLRKTGTC